MNYVDQLSHAAQIFRRTKALWLLGIIAALFGQSEYGFSVNYSERMPASTTAQPDAPFADMLANPFIAAFLANPIPYLLALGAIVLLWWIVMTLIGWLAQGAMIYAAAQADQGVSPTLRTSLRQSRKHIWSLFLMRLVLSIPTLVVVVIAALLVVPLFLSVFRDEGPDLSVLFPRLFGTVICLVPLFLLNALASIILNLLNTLAARACVLQDLTPRASLRHGWLLLRHNLGYTALNWFVLAIVGAIFGVVAAIPTLLLLIPTGQALLHNDWTPLTTIGAVGIVVYFLVMSIGAGGILTGLNSTVWTVLYQTFQHKAEVRLNDSAVAINPTP